MFFLIWCSGHLGYLRDYFIHLVSCLIYNHYLLIITPLRPRFTHIVLEFSWKVFKVKHHSHLYFLPCFPILLPCYLESALLVYIVGLLPTPFGRIKNHHIQLPAFISHNSFLLRVQYSPPPHLHCIMKIGVQIVHHSHIFENTDGRHQE